MNIGDLIWQSQGGSHVKKRLSVFQSYEYGSRRGDKLLDCETVQPRGQSSLWSRNGHRDLDEIDKVCARSDARGGDVSAKAVARICCR